MITDNLKLKFHPQEKQLHFHNIKNYYIRAFLVNMSGQNYV
jgi:hypothetical protein